VSHLISPRSRSAGRHPGARGPGGRDGYGEATVDRRLLAYYRRAWAVRDIGAYGEQVFLSPALGEETRRAALDGFMDLFEPGNIVDLASAPDASPP
jgi:hypothetical protein